ncbi:MAG: YihY family inner rane protein [Noviherbaspirillum sp.]|nr:YihY family inner rane protein [Noviherbaspirillum sp.]
MPSFNLQKVRQTPWSEARDLLRFARMRLTEERLPQVAGSLTFATVLALVPMLTIAFAIFTTFPLFNTFRTSLEAYFIQSLMPRTISNTILGYLSQFATKATRLSAVGAVALIVTAVAMMLTIDRAFNQIWRVKSSRPFAQRIVVYWAVVTLGPLLIGVSISVTSSLFSATNGMVRSDAFIGSVFYTLVSVLLTMCAFTLLYVAVPNRMVEWRDAACGGLVAAIAFEVAKRIFVVFVAKFPTYTMIYGALAAMPIFLVWVFVSWLIILVGAVIAAALPVVKYERWWHVPAPGSTFVDAIEVMRVLYEAREHGMNGGVDAGQIRAKTRLGIGELESLLEKMLTEGWVGCIKPDRPKRVQWGKHITEGLDSWTLLANPRRLKVADLYRLFVFHPSGNAEVAHHVERIIARELALPVATYFASHPSLAEADSASA